MKYTKSDYVLRIANSTPVQLVIITYEIALDYIDEAKTNLKENNTKEFHNNLHLATQFLQQLNASLDMGYEISWDLMSLYLYANKLIAQAGASEDPSHLDHAENILNTLLEAWHEIEKQEADKTPSLENAQHVYAGLTYGRGGLDEFVMEDKSRGFKA